MTWVAWHPAHSLWYSASSEIYTNKSASCNEFCINIFMSPDGLTWTQNDYPVGSYVSSFPRPSFFSGQGLLYSVYQDSVFTSDDALTWTNVFECSYYDLNYVGSIYPTPNGKNLILTGVGPEINMIYTSSDAINWERTLTNGAPTFLNFVYPASNSFFLALNASYTAYLSYSEDAGITWTNTDVLLQPYSESQSANMWMSNGETLCYFGMNATCANVSSDLKNKESWYNNNPFAGARIQTNTQIPPVLVNGQYVISSMVNGFLYSTTSPTGYPGSWSITNSQVGGYVNSFDSNDDIVVGVGPYGLLTSATFSS